MYTGNTNIAGWTCSVCGKYVAYNQPHSCGFGESVSYTTYPTEVSLILEKMNKRLGDIEAKLDLLLQVDRLEELVKRLEKRLKE